MYTTYMEHLPSINSNDSKNRENTNKSIDWNDLSVDIMMDLMKAIEPYEDEDWNISKIPNFIKDGVFDKKLFGGIMMYKAPQYVLVGSESSKEVLDFLKELNVQLKNPTLESTIEYLESQVPYLEASDQIHEKTFKEFDEIQNNSDKIEWFKDLEKNNNILNKANQANLLRVRTEAFLLVLLIKHTMRYGMIIQ